jgi:hypothetical protein
MAKTYSSFRLITGIFCLFVFWSCEKETPPVQDGFPGVQKGAGILVSNEGGFGFNNSSVDYYERESQTYYSSIFQNENQRPLGDVLQSISTRGEEAFLILNNSRNIEIVSLPDFKSKGAIGSFPAPRYLSILPSGKAYLTDLYADQVYVLDVTARAVLDSVYIGGWTEELLQWEETIAVSKRLDRWVYFIDPLTDQLVDSTEVGFDPSSMVIDAENHLWVLCSGDPLNQEPGGLYRLQPGNREIERALAFQDTEIGGWPRLTIHPEGETLYCIKKDVFQVPITATSFPSTPFFAAEGRIFYALGIDPDQETIFVGDAIDYQQKGLIYELEETGEIRKTHSSGVIPNGFIFY